jgi:hypothetical protein
VALGAASVSPPKIRFRIDVGQLEVTLDRGSPFTPRLALTAFSALLQLGGLE